MIIYIYIYREREREKERERERERERDISSRIILHKIMHVNIIYPSLYSCVNHTINHI